MLVSEGVRIRRYMTKEPQAFTTDNSETVKWDGKVWSI